MTNNNHHILDTNVILAMVLPGDNSFEDAKKYFKTAIPDTSAKMLKTKLKKRLQTSERFQ